jgi:hypothetical protein
MSAVLKIVLVALALTRVPALADHNRGIMDIMEEGLTALQVLSWVQAFLCF